MTFVVGLTGGIGSGKSTVADLFVQHGAGLVDTDVIAHELTGPQGRAMESIGEAFGAAFLSAGGGLNRDAMRQLIFSDPSAKVRLEAILHPLIRAESAARCVALDAPYVLLAIPLFVESGSFRETVDRVLVVDCDEAMQVSRVLARSKLALEQLNAIMAAQASRAERRAVADDLVLNNDAPEALIPQVEMLHRRYLGLASVKLKADC
jgi:dephospho-CoA kinase